MFGHFLALLSMKFILPTPIGLGGSLKDPPLSVPSSRKVGFIGIKLVMEFVFLEGF